MSRSLVAVLVSLSLAACAGAPPQEAAPGEYIGTLHNELSSYGLAPGGGVLSPAEDDDLAALGDRVPDGATVKVVDVNWKRDREHTLKVFVVQRDDKDLYAFFDSDSDGALERAEFTDSPDPFSRSEAEVVLPLDDGPFDAYPLSLTVPDYASMGIEITDETPDMLSIKAPVVEGSVDIDGRAVTVRLPYNFGDHAIRLTGQQMLDTDLDGTIDTWFTSRETVYHRAAEPPPIFRVGDRYVSFDSVNQEAGTFTLVARDPAEYTRIELDLGSELPDFDFIDFDGNQRKLSEFRGKIVLVDVWGSWCGPCREDVPYHLDAYAQYKDRGFEILGLDDEQSKDGEFDEGLQKGRDFVAEHGMSWPQATEESVKEFLVEGIRVAAWPTTILLDREGKIISLGRPQDEYGLRHTRLDDTLEQLLGADR